MNRALSFILGTLLLVPSAVVAGISFGQGGGFIVESGSALDISGATLVGGVIKTEGGNIVMSSPITGTGTTISINNSAYQPREMKFDGVLDGFSSLTLGDSKSLVMNGTTVTPYVVAEGSLTSPSMLRGIGGAVAFVAYTVQGGAPIQVRTGSALRVGMTGILNADISLHGDGAESSPDNEARLILDGDLALAPERGLYTSSDLGINTFDFQGNRLSIGGSATAPAILKGDQTWKFPFIFQTGPITLAASSVIAVRSTSQPSTPTAWYGNGHTTTISNSSGIDLGELPTLFVDTHFLGIRAAAIINADALTVKNGTFQDVAGQSLTLTGSVNADPLNLFFGATTFAGAQVRLNTDVRLEGAWRFDTGSDVSVIDLNGHILDMIHDDALISILSSTVQLRIKNGKILNLSASKLAGVTVSNASSRIIFENVEIVLSGTLVVADLGLTFSGDCTISGVAGAIIKNTSIANLVVSSGSTLRILDGVVYCHSNVGTTNFILFDPTSRLELIGSTFRRANRSEQSPAKLELTLGVLVIDHTVYIQPGTAGIQFGDGSDAVKNLSIEVRPGAALRVGAGGSGSGLQASAGAVVYANVS